MCNLISAENVKKMIIDDKLPGSYNLIDFWFTPKE